MHVRKDRVPTQAFCKSLKLVESSIYADGCPIKDHCPLAYRQSDVVLGASECVFESPDIGLVTYLMMG